MPTMDIQNKKRGATPTARTVNRATRVFFTVKPVEWSEAAKSLPDKKKVAPLDEIELEFKESDTFRNALHARADSRTPALWSDQKGLDSSGPHRINESGQSEHVSGAIFKGLKLKDRSFHIPGGKPVAVYYDHEKGLVLDASGKFDKAPVAYVAIDAGKSHSSKAVEGPIDSHALDRLAEEMEALEA